MRSRFQDVSQSQIQQPSTGWYALAFSGAILGAISVPALAMPDVNFAQLLQPVSVYQTAFDQFENGVPAKLVEDNTGSILTSQIIVGEVEEWGPGGFDDDFLMMS